MYEIVDGTAKGIFLVYIAILSACLLTYPIVRLFITAIKRGASRWR